MKGGANGAKHFFLRICQYYSRRDLWSAEESYILRNRQNAKEKERRSTQRPSFLTSARQGEG